MTTEAPAVRVRIPALTTELFPFYLSAEKAARMIGVSRPTLMKMIERDDIKGEKHPSTGHWLVSTKSVANFLGYMTEVVMDGE
jgi:hypothetical protein